jgi:hypothetical protein
MKFVHYPTPESDEVFGPRVFGERSKKCRSLETRLAQCREALQVVHKTGSWRLRKLAADTLKETAP